MNSVAIQEVLDAVRYKQGWYLHYCSHPSEVELWWSFTAPDYTDTAAPVKLWHGRSWFISDPVTEDSLVKTALAAALQTEEHECREAFTYRGVRLFDPHTSINKLMEAQCRST